MFRFIGDKLKNDKEFINDCIKINGYVYKFIDSNLISNEKIAEMVLLDFNPFFYKILDNEY